MRSEPIGRRAGDEGFTLLEVLVALTVLSVAMAGLGGFFINGAVTVSQQRDYRTAVQLANNTLEQVRALDGTALLDKRGQAKVEKQWQDAAAGPFKNELKPYFSAMAQEGDDSSEGENAALPTEPREFSVNGTHFLQNIFVGPCEVYVVASDDCIRPLAATDPKRPTDITSILEYFRVVVLVTWKHKSCTSNAGTCGYIASTLVSKNNDTAAFSSKRAQPDIRKPYMQTFYRGYPGSTGLPAISVWMKATGGNLPNKWSAVNLPDGLTINALTGEVTGTPTKVGTWTYATTGTYIRVVENEPPTGALSPRSDREEGLTWKVVDPPTLTMPPAMSNPGATVSLQPVVSGGEGPYTYAVDPALPATLTLNPNLGTITGKAPAQSYTTTITVTDANGYTGKLQYTHTVYGSLTLPVVPDQRVNVLSLVTLPAVAATGGNGKYTYSATGLPVELTMNANSGVISGGPVLLAGRYLPTVTVKDGLGATVSRTFVLEVATTGLTITAPGAAVTTVSKQKVNVPLTTNADAIKAKGVKFTAIGLPPGMKIGNNEFTGTPTVPGVYLVTVTATSSNPVQTAQAVFVWTVS